MVNVRGVCPASHFNPFPSCPSSPDGGQRGAYNPTPYKNMSNQHDIAHQWAHQIHPHGKASALIYRGPVIYSYATGIGRILPSGAVVLNVARFSIPSAKHQCYVRNAIPAGWRVFKYEDDQRGTECNPTPDQLLAYALQNCHTMLDKAARTRTKQGEWLGQMLSARQAVLDVCEYFSLPVPSDLPGNPTEEQMQAAREKVREMEQKRVEQAREKLALWQAGDLDTPAPHGLPFASFRLMPSDPDTVESTLGVRVPAADFARAVRFAMRFKGATWRPNPGEEIKVGGYRVNSITPAGVVAGCHRVGWSEVERLASFL